MHFKINNLKVLKNTDPLMCNNYIIQVPLDYFADENAYHLSFSRYFASKSEKPQFWPIVKLFVTFETSFRKIIAFGLDFLGENIFTDLGCLQIGSNLSSLTNYCSFIIHVSEEFEYELV